MPSIYYTVLIAICWISFAPTGLEGFLTFGALDVDHEGLLVGGLSAAHHLVDGVAGVVDRLSHVDPQNGPGVEPERFVFLALDDL